MKKKVLSIFLALIMIVGLIPGEAFAYLDDMSSPPSGTVTYGTKKISIPNIPKISAYTSPSKVNMDIYYLENDYIRFAIDSRGAYSSIIPTRIKDQEGEIPLTSWSRQSFSYQANQSSTETSLSIKSTKVTKDTVDGNPAIKVEYTFDNKNVSAYTTYQLIKLKKGKHHFNDDEPDNDDTWGVLSDGYVVLADGFFSSSGGKEVIFNWYNDFGGFPAMGHPKEIARELNAQVKLNSHNSYAFHDYINVSGGVGWTLTDDRDGRFPERLDYWYGITEAYVDSYNWSNPFVVTANDFYRDNLETYQELNSFPGEVKFSPQFYTGLSNLTTRDSQKTTKNEYDNLKKDGKSGLQFSQIWGYRDLIEGSSTEPTPPDIITLSEEFKRLAIFKNGSSYIAKPADSAKELHELSKTYGSPLVVIQGAFTGDAETGYTFESGSASLSPSVTATWNWNPVDKTKFEGFKVSSEGVFTNTAYLGLSNPSFKFYSKKPGAVGEDLKLEVTDAGLEITMDPVMNSAIISVDIPNFSSEVEKVIADTEGTLNFSGQIFLDSIIRGVSNIDLLNMQMSNASGKFSINGIEASGSIDAGNLLGINVAGVKGEINTFPGNEKYEFSLKINIPSILAVRGNLDLARLKSTGELLPDNLYVNAKTGLGGIYIAFIKIKGGGLGAYNMVATANGDYYALPPIKLRGTLDVSFFEKVNAKSNVMVGPGYISGYTTDMNIYGVNFLDYSGWELYTDGQVRTVNGVQYIGAVLGGNIAMRANFPNKTDNLISINTGIGLSFYTGINEYQRKGYAQLAANGRVSGVLQIPDRIAIIGGKKILGADVQAALSMETTVTANSLEEIPESALKNAKVFFGVVATSSILGSDIRGYYIVPENYGFDYKIFGSLDEWNWKDYGFSGLNNSPVQQATLLALESSLPSLESFVEIPDAEDRKISKSLTLEEGDIPDGGSLYLLITPEEGTDLEAFKNSLIITSPSGDLALAYLESLDGQALTLASANAAVDSQGTSLIINAGSQLGDYTVAADYDYSSLLYGSLDTWNWEEEGSTDLYGQASQMAGLFVLDKILEEAEPSLESSPDEPETKPESGPESTTEIEPEPEVKLQRSGLLAEKKEKTIEVTDIPAGGKLYLLITPEEGTDLGDLKTGLEVETPDGNLTLEYLESQGDEFTNSDTANVAIDLESNSLMVNAGSSNGSFTVRADHDFDLKASTSKPLTALEATLFGSTITGSITNPKEDTNYILRTYLGSEEGSSDYLISQTDLIGTSISEALSLSGTLIPSGSYYVSTYLMEELTIDGEEALLTVDSKNLGQVSYTNTAQPDAPTNVGLTARGNEVMNAQWSEVPGAHGYRINIYQVNGAAWEDTGLGYQFDTGDLGELAIFDGGNYKLDLAITGGDENLALEANRSYRIGVSAYKYLDESNKSGPVYSEETHSAGSLLPKYKPVEMEIIWDSELLSADSNGIYNCFFADLFSELQLSAEEASFRVTRMDRDQVIDSTEGIYKIYNNNFEGVLTLKVEAIVPEYVDGNEIQHITTRYIQVSKDTTPPVIVLDDDMVYADPKTGAYSIGGLTEPGATINGIETTATAGDDGRFLYEGILEKGEDGAFAGDLISLTATDVRNNESIPVFTAVSVDELRSLLTVTNGSGSGKYPVDTIITITADEAPTGFLFEKWSTDASVKLSDETLPSVTFTMPDKDVTIEALFKRDPSIPYYTYEIIEGADSSWKKGSSQGVEIKVDGDYDLFLGLKLDDQPIDKSDYSSRQGSLIVNLLSGYLETLEAGQHKLTFEFKDRDVDTNLTIEKNEGGEEPGQPDNPDPEEPNPGKPEEPDPGKPVEPDPGKPEEPEKPDHGKPVDTEKPKDDNKGTKDDKKATDKVLPGTGSQNKPIVLGLGLLFLIIAVLLKRKQLKNL